MVGWECPTNPREALGLDPEAVHWGYDANVWNQTGDVVIVENRDGDRVLEYEYEDRRPAENVSVSYDECTATVGGDGDGYDVEVETEYYSPDEHRTGEREREDVSLPVEVPSQNRVLPDPPPVVTTVVATSVTVSDEADVVAETENPNLEDCRAQIEEEWRDYRDGNGSDEPVENPEEIADSVDIADTTIETDDPGDERIVLENTADRPVDLSEWTVRDREDGGLVDAGVLGAFEFPDGFVLDGGERVTIWTGDGSDSETDLHWGIDRHIWNDDGDTIRVSSPDGGATIEESYRGGAPDDGDTDNTSGEESDLSVTYEDCSTVTVDGGGDDVTYEYEIATTFYVDDGIDTMIFEPGDQPSFTFDAEEQTTGAVTDVAVDAVTVLDSDAVEVVTHQTNPDDEACSDAIAQQYDDWQDEESDESDGESTGVETDAEDEDSAETDSEDEPVEDDADDSDGETDDEESDADADADDEEDGDGSDSDDDESEGDSDDDESEEDSDADGNEDGDEDSESDEGDGDDSDGADSDGEEGDDDSDSDDDGTSSDEDESEEESNSGGEEDDNGASDDADGENDDSETEDSTSDDGAGD